MDAAFFQRGILRLLAARDCGYAIKVGYWTYGITVKIRVGLNSGEVVVRAIGSDLRVDYSAVARRRT
jgi:class 3 adenylate cyclase